MRILWRVLERPAQAHEERIGVEPADADVGAPIGWETEQPRQPVRPELEASRANGELNRSGEGRPHVRGGRLQLGSRDRGGSTLTGRIDSEADARATQRLHDRAGRQASRSSRNPAPARQDSGVRRAGAARRRGGPD
jgi:hypothetical protein